MSRRLLPVLIAVTLLLAQAAALAHAHDRDGAHAGADYSDCRLCHACGDVGAPPLAAVPATPFAAGPSGHYYRPLDVQGRARAYAARAPPLTILV